MSDFPTLLYRTPGPHSAGGTKTYDFAPAADEGAAAALIADGWHETLPDALEPVKEVIKADDVLGDIHELRADYEAKFGKRPFMGWTAETLTEKMGASE